MAIYQPKREALGETDPANNFISDFSPQELWENKFLLFKPPSLHYIVMIAQAN